MWSSWRHICEKCIFWHQSLLAPGTRINLLQNEFPKFDFCKTVFCSSMTRTPQVTSRNYWNQTKWPIELWALKQERETNDDHATMREGFSLVQNIFFCCIHRHSSCPLVGIWLKSCRKLCNLVWSFDNRLLRELRVSLKGCMSTMVWYMNHSQA